MIQVIVRSQGQTHELSVQPGTNLRRALLAAGLSPYASLTSRANCGGRGLCATCGVFLSPAPEPVHWHDQLAERFGYPRLSCQIAVEDPMTVELLDDKRIWGERR